jgi:tRNA dimethylallyltransferase
VPDPLVISADALQVYEGLTVLTGAEPAHRLVGIVPVTSTFSAGEFAQLAHAEIDGAVASGRTAIVVGGTGLYLRAALTDLALRPPPPAGLRERLEKRLDEEGLEALHASLPPWVDVPASDRRRVLRALELHEMGELQQREGESQLWTDSVRHPTVLVGLVREREALNARIDARVDEMVAGGAADEVRAADAAGASRTARAALGFEQLQRGDVDAMKRDTRRYAKRQLTWMRKLAGVHQIDVTDRSPEDVAEQIVSFRTA